MSSSSSATILFVDDEPCMREIMAMVLSEEGFEVSTASDGFDALAQMRCSTPDLIISDLHMPGMSGIEFLSVVRRRFPAIPVIAISGAYDLEDFPAGVMADVFYSKAGCHPDQLIRSIDQLMRSTLSRPTHYHPCSPPRIQRARSMREGNGREALLLTCTDCLRAFSLDLTAITGQGIQESQCRFCNAPIQFFCDLPHTAPPAIDPGEQARASAA